jgi:hypothetical protein
VPNDRVLFRPKLREPFPPPVPPSRQQGRAPQLTISQARRNDKAKKLSDELQPISSHPSKSTWVAKADDAWGLNFLLGLSIIS